MDIQGLKDILLSFVKDKEVVDMFVHSKTFPYWEKSFTHESINYDYKKNYENFELIGDSFFGYSFSVYLKDDLNIKDPAAISNLSYYTSKHYQPTIAKKIGLDKFLIISPQVKVSDDILEDILESFFGVFDFICTLLKKKKPELIKDPVEYGRQFFQMYFSKLDKFSLSKCDKINKAFFGEFYGFISNKSTEAKFLPKYNESSKIFYFDPMFIKNLKNYDKSLSKDIYNIISHKGYSSEKEYIDKIVSLLKEKEYDGKWLTDERKRIKFDKDILLLATNNGLKRFTLVRNDKGSYDLLAQNTDAVTRKSITNILYSFNITDFDTLKEKSVEFIRLKYE